MTTDSVLVRMYDVGFGDCFFVKINVAGATCKMLFDCGSIKTGPRPIDAVVKDVIEAAKDNDLTSRIDVIVATHRHKDHVSGFASSLWKGVEVKEVWMPWTENPDDSAARKVRDSQSKLAAALASNTERKSALWAVDNPKQENPMLTAVANLAANALSNEAAMQTLHEGFAGNPLRRFFPTGNAKDDIFEGPVLKPVRVHVLGPSRDERVIRDMDPPAGQSYFQLYDGNDPASITPEPFREDWWVDADPPEVSYLLSAADRARVNSIGADLDFNLAAALDKAVNGTSLMLMLKIAGQWLLFSGDAQWGTWQAALENPQWKQLLMKTTFYKIGHHGSHNATPVDFVEHNLRNDFWAMASTHHVDQWPSIPKEELLLALRQKTTKIARSDKQTEAPAPTFRVVKDRYIETEIPLAL
jgi:beta-lactamase superfamily II metal-dependent hydrolase